MPVLHHMVLASCVLVAASPLQAQDAAAASRATRVYVERFDSRPTDAADDMARFATTYMQLELARTARLRVTQVAALPACGHALPSASQKSAAPLDPASFFVKGTVELTVDSGYVLDVEVVLCRRGVASLALHQARLFQVRNANSELAAFASIVSDRIRTADLPTVKVSVRSSGLGGPPMPLATLRSRIISAVRDVGSAQPVDTGSAEYGVSAVAVGPPGAPSKFRVQFAAGGREVGAIEMMRSRQTEDQFVAEAARASADKLTEIIHTPELAFGAHTGMAVRDSAIARARQALCLGVTLACRPAPDAARAALGTLRRSQSDVDVLTLDGLSDLASGNLGSALSMLTRADSLRALAPQVARIPEASGSALRMAIAKVYRTAGNYPAAVREYERLLTAAPGDSALSLLLAQTLRLAGRHVAALDVLTRELAHSANPALAQEARAAIDDVPFNVASDSLGAFVALCSRDRQVRLGCASSFADKAVIGHVRGRPLSRARPLLDAASRMAADDPATLWRVRIAYAAAYLGSPFDTYSQSRLEYRSSEFVPDSVARYVRLTADRAPAGVSDTARALLQWVVANDAALRGNYGDGVSAARAAYAILPSREYAVLATTLAMVLSSHADSTSVDSMPRRYALQWAELRPGARPVIDAAWRRYPDDDSVIEVRSRLCTDYDFDPGCLFESDSVRYARGVLRAPNDILDAVEAAVLSDHASTALEWLKRVPRDGQGACTVAVSALYEFWARSELEPVTPTAPFDRWSQGITQYRHDSSEPCWIFNGAKARLSLPASPKQQRTLRAMIAAYEDSSAPIPSRPAASSQ